ncbi:MAG: hypothetical protein LBM87_04755 [Ruminococcus sp.]|jgi:hypothetical protein|nr:hypothetical protein [Ruminococcus sp.]
MKKENSRKKFTIGLISALTAVVMGSAMFISAGAADGIKTKQEWAGNNLEGAILAAGYSSPESALYEIVFTSSNVSEDPLRDFIVFKDNTYEYSYNGSTWFDLVKSPESTAYPYTIDITKQIKADKKVSGAMTDQELVIYLRDKASDPAGQDPTSFLPVANVNKDGVEGTSRGADKSIAYTIVIPVSRDAKPTVAASFKTTKQAEVGFDGVSKVTYAADSAQKDVTYNPADNSLYIKKDLTRKYFMSVGDSYELIPLNGTDVEGMNYSKFSLDSYNLNNAIKLNIAYAEVELNLKGTKVAADGDIEHLGPMSKPATLSIPKKPAAPKISVDIAKGTFKGTKALSMEYAIGKQSTETAATTGTLEWGAWTTVPEANMQVSDATDALYVAFRNKAVYNKRASEIRVVEMPESSAITEIFNIENIEGKIYLTHELDVTDYAEPLSEEGGSKFATGKSNKAIPFTYGENKVNTLQIKVTDMKNDTTDETTGDPVVVNDEVIQDWVDVTWSPLDGGEIGKDKVILDITDYQPEADDATSDGYVIEVRVKANGKVTPDNPTKCVQSQSTAMIIREAYPIGTLEADKSKVADGQITYTYVADTGWLLQEKIGGELKNLGVESETVYQISLDGETWDKYKTLEAGDWTVKGADNKDVKHLIVTNPAGTNGGKTIIVDTYADSALNIIHLRVPEAATSGLRKDANGNWTYTVKGYLTSDVVTIEFPFTDEISSDGGTGTGGGSGTGDGDGTDGDGTGGGTDDGAGDGTDDSGDAPTE